MKEYLKNNLQFLFLISSLTGIGIFMPILSYIALLLIVFLLWRRERYAELLIGFLFVLVISDNLIESFDIPYFIVKPFGFAKTLKYEYIALLFAIFVVDRQKFAPYSNLIRPFIIFFLIALFSFISYPSDGVVSPFESIARWISYIMLLIIVPNFTAMALRNDKINFLKQIFYFAFLILITGILIKYIDTEAVISHGNRLRGWFGNPNGLGIFSVLILTLFAIVNGIYPSMFHKVEKIIFYLLIFYIIIKTDSRNALLCAIILFVFANLSSFSSSLAIILSMVVALTVPLIMTNLPVIIHFFSLEDYFRLNTLEEGSGRFIAWEFAWEYIVDFPLLGRGMGFDLNLMRENFDFLSRLGHQGGVHNTYLILWLNTGIIGLVAFFRAFFLLFIKASKKSHYAIPFMLVVIFSIIFEPWLAASLNPFTILFLITLTLLLNEDFFPVKNDNEAITEDTEAVENATN